MTELGGVFRTTVQLSASSFTTVFAPSGEQIKITMAYLKLDSSGERKNADLSVSPASGAETSTGFGTSSSNDELPPLGANPSFGASDVKGLQPINITDSNGIYISSVENDPVDVILQGVRVA